VVSGTFKHIKARRSDRPVHAQYGGARKLIVS
jgi:hypothetical protein